MTQQPDVIAAGVGLLSGRTIPWLHDEDPQPAPWRWVAVDHRPGCADNPGMAADSRQRASARHYTLA